jgi:hypothetical protein
LIAALFVEMDGIYSGLPEVEPWDKRRDARVYQGPWPVVAHPPCERWGRYWGGAPGQKPRLKLGDDDGCFAAALQAVRQFGGVLEHPEASHAWRRFGIVAPPRKGGWVPAGLLNPGFTCCVEQGAYGHRARKATWLYAVKTALPDLQWIAVGDFVRLDEGFHSSAERAAKIGTRKRISARECAATPPEFRDLLLSIARTVEPVTNVA